MNEYFRLQYRMFNRRLKDAGLNPVVGWLLLLLIYAGLSTIFFIRFHHRSMFMFLCLCTIFSICRTSKETIF
jgi:uncharacterized membrane protein YhaH (DUF805 family)